MEVDLIIVFILMHAQIGEKIVRKVTMRAGVDVVGFVVCVYRVDVC